MNFLIHRGTHEIGGSCIEVWTDTTRIILDMGMPLVVSEGEPFDARSLKGKSTPDLVEEGILPNVEGLYQKSKGMPIDGVLLSHPHQDHYGFLSYISGDIPVHLSEPAHILIDILRMFTGKGMNIKRVEYYEHSAAFTIGDITITPYLQDHSAFSAFGFHINDGEKSLYYTGDFRGHGRKGKLLQYMQSTFPTGIDALLMEGTNIPRGVKPAKKESELEKELRGIFQNNDNGLTLFAASGQNIDRLVTFYRAAKSTGKDLVIDLYTAYVLYRLGDFNPSLPRPSGSWKNLRIYYFKHHADALVREGLRSVLYKFKPWKVEAEDIEETPGHFIMMIRSGKYPEKFIKNYRGQAHKYIYSLWAGYQEQETTKEFTDLLANRGFEYTKVHTSGHADVPTLQWMAKIINPSTIIPIHTFQPDEFQRHFSQPVKVLEDGEVFTL